MTAFSTFTMSACGDTRLEVDLRCTVTNTSRGTDNTAEGEERRYQAGLARLSAGRAARYGLEAVQNELREFLPGAIEFMAKAIMAKPKHVAKPKATRGRMAKAA